MSVSGGEGAVLEHPLLQLMNTGGGILLCAEMASSFPVRGLDL